MILLQKPQVNISCSTSGRMWLVAGCAFLCILQSAASDGGQSLTIALTVFFTALLFELLLTWKKSGITKITDGSAAAAAMVLTLLLPNQLHPIYAALGVMFAIGVVKYSSGGLGANWLNPALAGWLFIRFSWPAVFAKALEGSAASIAEMSLSSGASGALDNSVSSFLNDTIFSVFGAQMPSGYIDLLFSKNPGIIADRGLFALLAGTVIITALGINRGWIPLVFLSVYGFLIRLTGDLPNAFWNGDILYGFFSGGTIAAAFILAAEPATSAKLKQGVLAAVISGAVLSWVFRYRCLEYSGCFIALAAVNCMTPLLRFLEEKFFLFPNDPGVFSGDAS
jgi:electron transport complex protein RnfD